MTVKEKVLDWTYIRSESDIPTHGGQVLVSWGFTEDFRNGGPFVDQARWEKAYGWKFGPRKANDLFIYAWRDLPKAAAWQNAAKSLPAAPERVYVPFTSSDACWCQPFDGPVHPECPMHKAKQKFEEWWAKYALTDEAHQDSQRDARHAWNAAKGQK